MSESRAYLAYFHGVPTFQGIPEAVSASRFPHNSNVMGRPKVFHPKLLYVLEEQERIKIQ
jgi:hypothetical protein